VSWEAQLAHLEDVVRAGLEPDLPIAIDFEDSHAGFVANHFRSFLNHVAVELGSPIVYTAKWVMDRYAEMPWLAEYLLWVAHYGAPKPA
jgi:GH25 family lysozyme M1 (1,4-beta-N-acetylmuramidase)